MPWDDGGTPCVAARSTTPALYGAYNAALPGPALSAGGYANAAAQDAFCAGTTRVITVLGGQKAYGVYIAPGTGYRNNNTNGVATGDQPEGIYAVVDGTHYNQWCCFDYGNAQTDGKVDAPAIMETVSFGANKQWGYGAGAGPWIMAIWSGGCSPV